MPGVKRAHQSFTFEYKLKVIAWAVEIGNRAAAREFEIDESMIRYWQKKKVVMTKLPKRQHTCHTELSEKFINLWLLKNLHLNGLCTAMRAYHHSNFVSSRISFVFGCGLSASVGNLLKCFSCYCKK